VSLSGTAGPGLAGTAFYAAHTRLMNAERELKAAAIAALKERILDKIPDAKTLTAEFEVSDEGNLLTATSISTGDGRDLVDRFADSSELDELLHSFQADDDLSAHFSVELGSSGPAFVLDLTEKPQPRTIETIDAELAAAANRREFVLASEALAATIKEDYPDAHELEIEDSGDGEGSPYYTPSRIVGGNGETLWSADSYETDGEFADTLTEYTQLLDRVDTSSISLIGKTRFQDRLGIKLG
jgi:hypothetical protein